MTNPGVIRSLSASATLALCLALAGCNQTNASGAQMAAEPVATTLAPIKVDLPAMPSWAIEDLPVKSADGFYTVRGLRKMKKETLTKEVKVRATLVDIYQCPVCPKGQTCKLCDQPHFFLGDKADTPKEKALMVVDYLLPRQKPPVLTVGKEYEVEGTFSINSPTGFGSSDGLIIFTRMKDDKGTEFLSQAQQLEDKAKLGEAIEASLAAKRKKALK
jgi:hypothetical protein